MLTNKLSIAVAALVGCTLAAPASLALAAAPAGSVLAATSAKATGAIAAPAIAKPRVVRGDTGKLVVKDARARTFTLQCTRCPARDKSRVFTAPAGTDLAALTGKDVRVMINSAGQVSAVRRATTTRRAAAHPSAAKEKKTD